MAERKPKLKITLMGTGINETILAVDHEMIGLHAATYHKITLVSGTVVFYNDFGIRSVWVETL